jgi:excisionase family DNA binding protein
MMTAEEAAALAKISVRKLYQWVEKGSLHFVETPSGQVWICLTSLMQKREPAKARSRGA